MGITLIQPSFATGELTPSLYGRVDFQKWHSGASTMRNFFVNYRGGASSRAGTAFVGASRQTGSFPPRLIRFQFSLTQGLCLEFGNLYMRVISNGAYVIEAAKTISGVTKAAQAVVTANLHGFSNGDDVYITGIVGMTELNGNIYRVSDQTTNTFKIKDIFGNYVDSTNFTAYSSGGSASRLYTLATPYIAEDLASLKFTQSADTMTIVHPKYAPRDLVRVTATNWTLTATTFGTSIGAPTSLAGSASSTGSTSYQYAVTAVDLTTGEESVASNIASITGAVNITATAGAITLTWDAVTGAGSYKAYRAPIAPVSTAVPDNSLFGYIGETLGASFVDNNIIADFSYVPPVHLNPFAPGQILYITMTNGGSGYTSAPTVSITTSTGSDAVLRASVSGGKVQNVVVVNGGHDYAPGDTISFSGGAGSNAAGTLTIGPATGTYPSVVAYFQQRRVYANTNNNPDTYFMSQTGAYKNMDSSPIPIDSDAIIGTPWAQQVDGIQALVPMPGGLIVLTGLGAWQVTGGGQATPITPVNQNAQPQAYNGCHDKILPIVINYDILYVQSKGSIVRDLSYNFYVNIYTGTDLSLLSNHLFQGFTLIEWAWCEEPYKVLWCVRSDGTLLSLTYLKEQEISGWARHDTNGLFKSVTSVTENLVDALYCVVQRYIQGQWLYYIERMNDRLWNTLEDSWCLDSALAYPSTTPNATLSASQANQPGLIGSVVVVYGGSGYTDPQVVVRDNGMTGSGAICTATQLGGVVTSISVVDPGSGYTAPQIIIQDATGAGAVAEAVLDNVIEFTTDASVFTADNVGDVIRSGGGVATIVTYNSGTSVDANLTTPITQVLNDDARNTPIPITAGNWTLATPTQTVGGLGHLEGMVVKALADGNVNNDLVVEGGQVTLTHEASSIIVGLPFIAQLQSMYTDLPGQATVQGKRKRIFQVTVRVEESRGIEVGTNQPDASLQQNDVNIPWKGMTEIKERSNAIYAGTAIPLFTGDEIVNVNGSWKKPGQVAVQQRNPLPANILAFIPETVIGDDDG